MNMHEPAENPNESLFDRWERISAKPKPRTKEEAKEEILDQYYYASDKNKGKIFLVKQNQFVPLEDLDEKLAEYKKKKNSPETTVQRPWSTVAKSQVVKIGSHLVFPRKIHSGQPLQNLAERF